MVSINQFTAAESILEFMALPKARPKPLGLWIFNVSGVCSVVNSEAGRNVIVAFGPTPIILLRKSNNDTVSRQKPTCLVFQASIIRLSPRRGLRSAVSSKTTWPAMPLW